MRDIIRLFIFAFWVTLCIWAWVEYEYKKANTITLDPIIVTPNSGDNNGRSSTNK